MRLSKASFLRSPIQHIAALSAVLGASAPAAACLSGDAGTATANLGLGLWIAATYFWVTGGGNG